MSYRARLRVAAWGLLATFSLVGLHLAPAPAQTEPVNLLQNGSFEVDGTPSLEGWQPGNPELATLMTPGGPSGGDWSLRLEADWAPTLGYVLQPVTGVQDGDIVELRADVKAEGNDGGGAVTLITGQHWWNGKAKGAYTASDSWTTLSIVDTLEIGEGDTTWVRLTSFNTEIVPRVGFFDSVTLTVVGSTPTLPSTWGSLKTRYQ